MMYRVIFCLRTLRMQLPVKVISLDQPVLMLHAHRAIAFNIRECLRTHPFRFLLTRLPQNNMGPTPEEFSEN